MSSIQRALIARQIRFMQFLPDSNKKIILLWRGNRDRRGLGYAAE
jgi:hypothetical protein